MSEPWYCGLCGTTADLYPLIEAIFNRKKEKPHQWKPDKAVVAQSRGTNGVVLWTSPDSYIEEDIRNVSNRTDSLGLDDAPEGISIWEGEYRWHRGGWECPQDGDCELVGTFRVPTEEEWRLIRLGVNPFR